MADGSQHGFNFPRKALVSALRPGEIVVDLFAGGGGASEALKQALGRDPDLAYNHDELAVGLHAANHPFTAHKREDIWVADPRAEVGGRAVGWFHASPDCTHFSQAKGGQPRSRATRSLSWVVLKWAGSLARGGNAPRIISLENVEQILTWGPLVAKRCKITGRVIKLDGTVAARGEQVSVWQQALVPDKRHAGRTWSQFVAALRGLGYVVEWRKLIASDYGAGTSRKRLFLIARRDGQPIARALSDTCSMRPSRSSLEITMRCSQADRPAEFPNLWILLGWHDETRHAQKVCEVLGYVRNRAGRERVRVRFVDRQDLFDPTTALLSPHMLAPYRPRLS
jgi:DNA (cytosine-5)-methyltransferase 1